MKKAKSWQTLIKNLKNAHIKYMGALVEYNGFVERSHASAMKPFFNVTWTGAAGIKSKRVKKP